MNDSLQPSAILLAEPADVKALALADPAFAKFFSQSLFDSGLRTSLEQAQRATYKVTLAKGMVHYDLHYQSRLGNADASPTIADLVGPLLECPVESLIHSVWATKSLKELQALVHSLRAVARFSPGPRGELQGNVLMSGHVNLLLDYLADGHRIMDDGESMLDAVTRNLGLRRKASMLIEHTGNTSSQEHEYTDAGLARTLVQNWNK